LLVGVSPSKGTKKAPREVINGGYGGSSLSCLEGSLRKLDGEVEEVELQLGIIDFLQCWTPKKIAAHWFKKSTIGCFHEIDTEPPAKYRQRFYKYFLTKIEATTGRPIRSISFEGLGER